MPQNIENNLYRFNVNIGDIITPIWFNSYIEYDFDGLIPETIINVPISYKKSLNLTAKSKKFKLVKNKKIYQPIKSKYYNNNRKIFRSY